MIKRNTPVGAIQGLNGSPMGSCLEEAVPSQPCAILHLFTAQTTSSLGIQSPIIAYIYNTTRLPSGYVLQYGNIIFAWFNGEKVSPLPLGETWGGGGGGG